MWGDNCPERLDWDFIKWTWNFNKKFRKDMMEQVNGCGKRTYIFKRRADAAKFLADLTEADDVQR